MTISLKISVFVANMNLQHLILQFDETEKLNVNNDIKIQQQQ